MNYEFLYTFTLVIFALIIAWCFFKIRKLKDENTYWRGVDKYMLRQHTTNLEKIIELDKKLEKLKS